MNTYDRTLQIYTYLRDMKKREITSHTTKKISKAGWEVSYVMVCFGKSARIREQVCLIALNEFTYRACYSDLNTKSTK